MSWPVPLPAPPRVLVADDHAVNLRLTRRLLEIDGCTVRTVTSGSAALEKAYELQPDLILADLYLPGLDGLALARALKSDPATRELRIVAFTAAAMDSDRAAALAAGFDDHLAKPISSRQFSDFIARQLDVPPLRLAG